jgi:hypothetical protein
MPVRGGYPVFALRFDTSLLFRPFYGEAQPWLLLGPRPRYPFVTPRP